MIHKHSWCRNPACHQCLCLSFPRTQQTSETSGLQSRQTSVCKCNKSPLRTPCEFADSSHAHGRVQAQLPPLSEEACHFVWQSVPVKLFGGNHPIHRDSHSECVLTVSRQIAPLWWSVGIPVLVIEVCMHAARLPLSVARSCGSTYRRKDLSCQTRSAVAHHVPREPPRWPHVFRHVVLFGVLVHPCLPPRSKGCCSLFVRMHVELVIW